MRPTSASTSQNCADCQAELRVGVAITEVVQRACKESAPEELRVQVLDAASATYQSTHRRPRLTLDAAAGFNRSFDAARRARPRSVECDRHSDRTDRQPARPRVPTWLRVLLPTVLILVWFAAFGAGGASFGSLSDVVENDQAQFLPADAESTEVQELQAGFRVGRRHPGDRRLRARRRADRCRHRRRSPTTRRRSPDIDGVVDDGVSPAVTSDDGAAAEVFVQVDASAEVDEVVGELRERVAATAAPTGLEAAVTGPAGFTTDLIGAFAGIDGLLLLVAFAAVFVILVIVYRSPLLPLIVLGTSLTALCASVLTVVGARARRRARAQRPDPGHPVHPRDRRGDRLLAALHRALPRGAAHARAQVGCHVVGAPRRVGADPRLGRHRDRRPADAAR